MRALRLLLLGGILALSGCFLDRLELPSYDLDAEVSATRYCSGDEITISWTSSSQLRAEEHCACTADIGCGDPGSICFDGQCAVRGASASDAEGRCAEPVFASVIDTNTATTIRRIRGPSGSVTVAPAEGRTARYEVVMNRSGVLQTRTLRAIQVPADTEYVDNIRFNPPNCQPFIGPIAQDLADLPSPLVGTDRVEVSLVQQLSSYDMFLNAIGPAVGIIRGPVRLPRRFSTAEGAMRGPLAGVWTVQPASIRPSPPNPAGCQTAGAEPFPPIELRVQTMCLPEQ